MPRLSLAEQFRRFRRHHKHISQKELARAMGVSPRTVAGIELGETPGNRHTRNKFMLLKAKHDQEERKPKCQKKW